MCSAVFLLIHYAGRGKFSSNFVWFKLL
jgi:hypothetical protein